MNPFPWSPYLERISEFLEIKFLPFCWVVKLEKVSFLKDQVPCPPGHSPSTARQKKKKKIQYVKDIRSDCKSEKGGEEKG